MKYDQFSKNKLRSDNKKFLPRDISDFVKKRDMIRNLILLVMAIAVVTTTLAGEGGYSDSLV